MVLEGDALKGVATTAGGCSLGVPSWAPTFLGAAYNGKDIWMGIGACGPNLWAWASWGAACCAPTKAI